MEPRRDGRAVSTALVKWVIATSASRGQAQTSPGGEGTGRAGVPGSAAKSEKNSEKAANSSPTSQRKELDDVGFLSSKIEGRWP